MGTGTIIGGVILIIIGVIVYGLFNNYQSQCQSFLGNLGQNLDSEYQQRCTIIKLAIILSAIMAVIGIVLVIVGAVSKARTPKQPKQQFRTPQENRTQSMRPTAENQSETKVLNELERLGNLKQKGTITEEEFQKLKSQVLEGSSPRVHPLSSDGPRLSPTKQDNMESITSDFHIYENSRLGIRMQYPPDWKVYEKDSPSHSDEKQRQVVGFSSTRAGDVYSELENVALYVKNLLSQNMTIDAYAKKQIVSIQPNVKESTPTTVAGAPAYRVVYRGTKGDMILEVLEVWIIKHDKLYTITCIAAPNDFSHYASIFQNMIDSFEIV